MITFIKNSRIKRKAKSPDQLHYDKDTDTFYSPMGQAMTNIGSYKKKTKNGFEQELHRYQAQNGVGCPLRGLYLKAKTKVDNNEKGLNLTEVSACKSAIILIIDR